MHPGIVEGNGTCNTEGQCAADGFNAMNKGWACPGERHNPTQGNEGMASWVGHGQLGCSTGLAWVGGDSLSCTWSTR
jgi:hypothetical protein